MGKGIGVDYCTACLADICIDVDLDDLRYLWFDGRGIPFDGRSKWYADGKQLDVYEYLDFQQPYGETFVQNFCNGSYVDGNLLRIGIYNP